MYSVLEFQQRLRDPTGSNGERKKRRHDSKEENQSARRKINNREDGVRRSTVNSQFLRDGLYGISR